jgi:hypothetical protein
MLLPDNIHPENSLYYIGSIVLKVLLEKRNIDFLDLYTEVRSIKPVSISVYILCIDWLYIAGIADNSLGIVKLCS